MQRSCLYFSLLAVNLFSQSHRNFFKQWHYITVTSTTYNEILSWWGIASTVAPPQYCWTFSFVISLRFPRNLLSNLYQVFRLKPKKSSSKQFFNFNTIYLPVRRNVRKNKKTKWTPCLLPCLPSHLFIFLSVVKMSNYEKANHKAGNRSRGNI